MVKKTYKTFSLKGLVIRTHDKWGRPVCARFTGGIQIDSTATFVTVDPEMQRILESCSGFNRDYFLAEERDMAPKSEAPAKEDAPKVAPAAEEKTLADVKDIKRFRNLVEMKNAMKELGLEVKDEWNYTATKAAAAKEGYDFQIKK